MLSSFTVRRRRVEIKRLGTNETIHILPIPLSVNEDLKWRLFIFRGKFTLFEGVVINTHDVIFIIYANMRARLPCGLLGCIRGMALYRSSGYIGGKWKDCETKFPVYNPATGQEIGRVSDMGREDAEEAVKQAYDAFKVWKNVTTKV